MLKVDLTPLLFSFFPREMGNPKRTLAWNENDFKSFVNANNGINDVFTSVYDVNLNIDKIFFDFDGDKSLEESIKIYNYLKEQNYNVIPVASGKKGIHLYLLLKNKNYGLETKQLLYNATVSIVKKSFNGETGKCVDKRIFGDIRRLCRVPNTLRPPKNLGFCTYLPDDFVNFTRNDLERYLKAPHNIEYKINGKFPTLNQLIDNKLDLSYEMTYEDKGRTITVGNGCKMLKLVLRPCLYRYIEGIHPPHEVRVASTIDLLQLDLSVDCICDFYKQLGWEDFDESYTRYQIEHLRRSNYQPFGCKRLITLGIPENPSECNKCPNKRGI